MKPSWTIRYVETDLKYAMISLYKTNEQGFLLNFSQWSESYAIEMARKESIKFFFNNKENIATRKSSEIVLGIMNKYNLN